MVEGETVLKSQIVKVEAKASLEELANCRRADAREKEGSAQAPGQHAQSPYARTHRGKCSTEAPAQPSSSSHGRTDALEQVQNEGDSCLCNHKQLVYNEDMFSLALREFGNGLQTFVRHKLKQERTV